MADLTVSSLVELAALVRARKISPVELVEAHLVRIERLNPKLNAFITVDSEGAGSLARAAEQAAAQHGSGDSLGPLHGVPVSIKSSIDVAGFLCECGSRLRKGFAPQSDAPLVSACVPPESSFSATPTSLNS